MKIVLLVGCLISFSSSFFERQGVGKSIQTAWTAPNFGAASGSGDVFRLSGWNVRWEFHRQIEIGKSAWWKGERKRKYLAIYIQINQENKLYLHFNNKLQLYMQLQNDDFMERIILIIILKIEWMNGNGRERERV